MEKEIVIKARLSYFLLINILYLPFSVVIFMFLTKTDLSFDKSHIILYLLSVCFLVFCIYKIIISCIIFFKHSKLMQISEKGILYLYDKSNLFIPYKDMKKIILRVNSSNREYKYEKFISKAEIVVHFKDNKSIRLTYLLRVDDKDFCAATNCSYGKLKRILKKYVMIE